MNVQMMLCLLDVLLKQTVQTLKEALYVHVSLALLVMVELMEMDVQVCNQHTNESTKELISPWRSIPVL